MGLITDKKLRRKVIDEHNTLIHADHLFDATQIEIIEKEKNAVYVGEFTLKTPNGEWANTPVAIFYSWEKHPEGSNYFGLFYSTTFKGKIKKENISTELRITDGISAIKDKNGQPVIYTGKRNKLGEILYSAYRHDYQTHGDLMVDGGREYTRASIFGDYVKFCIDGFDIKLYGDTI